MSQVDSAICFFNKSVNSQNVYLQFHHICYWELLWVVAFILEERSFLKCKITNFRFAHAYNRDWTKSANYARLLYKESKWSRCVYTYLVKWSCSHSNFLFLIYYVRGLQMCIFFAADTSVEENKRKETIAALARLEKSWKTSNKWIFRKVDTCRMRIAGKSIPIEKFCAKRAKRFLSTGSLLFAHYARISATSSFHYEAFRNLSISGTDLTLSARTRIW